MQPKYNPSIGDCISRSTTADRSNVYRSKFNLIINFMGLFFCDNFNSYLPNFFVSLIDDLFRDVNILLIETLTFYWEKQLY